MAAPWSDESSTRRSALPSVRPKPRSSGSATKVALRLPSLPALISRLLGFFNSCQFRILTVMDFPLLLAGRMGVGHLSSEDFIRAAPRRWGAPVKTSDAAPLGRAAAIVRDRRPVADRRDGETDGPQRVRLRLQAGPGAR